MKDFEKPDEKEDSDSKEDANAQRQEEVKSIEVKDLGKFACFLKNYDETVYEDAMSQVSKLLPSCIHRINEETKRDMQKMFENRIDTFLENYTPLLPSLGPIFPLIDSSFIETMSDEVVTQLLPHVPPLHLLLRKRKPILEDDSTNTFSFKSNLLLNFPEESKSFVVRYNPIDIRGFATTVFPKLKSHINKIEAQENSRKRRSNTEYDEESNLMYNIILYAGPAVVGLSVSEINDMSDALINDTLGLFGSHTGWNNDQLNALKSKVLEIHREISALTSTTLQKLGHIASMFSVEDINKLTGLDLNSMEVLSYVEWPSNNHVQTLFLRYLTVNKKEIKDLNGLELVVLGDILCGIKVDDITSLDETAIKFASSHLGKLRCLGKDQRTKFKSKIMNVLGENINNPSLLNELGILTGSLESSDFGLISPRFTSLMSSDAFYVVSSENTKSAWNESHFALLGTENAAAVILRPDFFKSLAKKSQNAVFRSVFGNNAGMVSSQIQMLEFGKDTQEKAYQRNQGKMLQTVTMLFSKMYTEQMEKPIFGGPGSFYGLEDPQFFIKPPPPDFAFGLSISDFSTTFGM